MFFNALRNIAAVIFVVVLMFSAIYGINNIENGGGWILGPVAVVMMSLMFRPWEWTIDGLKNGLKISLNIGVFAVLLIIFITTFFAAVANLVLLQYGKMLGMASLCVLSYLGMIKMIKT